MATDTTMKRLHTEWKALQTSPPDFATAAPIDESNMFKWIGTIIGPDGTPYEGGVFELEINFPKDFPFGEPKLKFTTKMFHPNVSPDGEVCAKALWGEQWRAAMTIRDVLKSLVGLFKSPDPSSPLNDEAAVAYTQNVANFNKVAAQWTQQHAQ